MAYIKQTFEDGQKLHADSLNKMSEAIFELEYANTTSSDSIENSFKGKVISILGDSISTFSGYIPTGDGRNLTHKAYYPQSYLTSVEDTWWHKLITDLGAKLGINESWSGSFVGNTKDTDTVGTGNDTGPNTCMASITRITNLGSNGTPDVIFFYGGTNDAGKGSSSLGETLGSFDSTKEYKDVDLTTTKWDTFAEAYRTAIMRLQYYYPTSRIIVLLPTFTQYYYTIASLDAFVEVIREICDYFGIYYIDLRRAGLNYINRELYYGHENYIHPNPEGMTLIKTYVKRQLLNAYEGDFKENVVYTVTNDLSTLTNEKFYVKGVSAGQSFTATFSGDDLTVLRVAMNGTDVTSSVYDSSTGEVNIPSITGPIEFSEGASTGDGTKWYTSFATSSAADGTEIAMANYAGFTYQDANDKYLEKTINAIRLRVAQAGSMTIGIASEDRKTISNTQIITLTNPSTTNVQIYKLATPITLSSNQVLCFGAQGDTGLFYYKESGTASASNGERMWHHVGTSSATAATSTASLTIDAGYVPD